ncbi:hypothetical protein AVEN_197279-1 [Araneus ventricosus]|uniref:Uncharacterized protein n=1 Tax=Araneus ventricosus TaxID=182803 RepID=A0A4Y2TDQ1_ARAVE|nr:hypothetical protein AVEN_197279-1 [Araneus ventricosus]
MHEAVSLPKTVRHSACSVMSHESNMVSRNEISYSYLQNFQRTFSPYFSFMDDNACLHMAGVLYDYHETEDYRQIDWLTESLELNPIKNFWDYVN